MIIVIKTATKHASQISQTSTSSAKQWKNNKIYAQIVKKAALLTRIAMRFVHNQRKYVWQIATEAVTTWQCLTAKTTIFALRANIGT